MPTKFDVIIQFLYFICKTNDNDILIQDLYAKKKRRRRLNYVGKKEGKSLVITIFN